MIDSSEKRNRQLAFELQNSHVCEKRSNESQENQQETQFILPLTDRNSHGGVLPFMDYIGTCRGIGYGF